MLYKYFLFYLLNEYIIDSICNGYSTTDLWTSIYYNCKNYCCRRFFYNCLFLVNEHKLKIKTNNKRQKSIKDGRKKS